MKKLMSVILAVTMMLSVLCAGAVAEQNPEDVIDVAEGNLNGFFHLAEWFDGYFAEGGSPSAQSVYQHFLWNSFDLFEEYYVGDTEWGFCIFEVPAEVYEAEVFKVFGNEDAVRETLRAGSYYKTDKAEPYYAIEMGGGFGGYCSSLVVRGYTEGDGTVTVYAYVCDTYIFDEDYNEQEYVPAEDEVEGVDYIYMVTNVYEYDEETGEYSMGAKYAPAKISDGFKSVMTVDTETFESTFYSYERINKNEVPAAEDLITRESNKDVALVGGAFMEIDTETFGIGTTIYGEEYYDDPEAEENVYADTAEILKDRGELGGVYEFYAMNGAETVQPKEKVPVSFILPYDFSPDVTVYYIDENGVATELETAVDPDSWDPSILYATAELEHFSRYAVAGTRHGDSNSDGKVNLTDVSAMLKKIAKWDVELNDVAVDATRDGKLNLSDVSLVLKYVAQWDVVFG